MKRAFTDDLPHGLWSAAARLCITIPAVAAVGGVASAAIGASATESAAKTQADAANKAQASTERMYQQTRSDLAPYRDLGSQAMPNYMALLGAGPQGAAGELSA